MMSFIKKKEMVAVIAGGIIALALCVSGWVYTAIEAHNNAKDKELATLTSAFSQQYGTDGITIKQIVSPEKVYVAVWTNKDGTTNVSWNIGGLWVTVYSGMTPEITGGVE